ncbi:MAG: response regulator transcription factor [Planctomycetota bacterium]
MTCTQTILVVEDDAAVRRGLVDALRFAGYAVIDSGSGRGAVDLAIESSVDLVLLDVMLPEVDGFTILDELRHIEPTLPVIMVTARGAEDDRVRGLKTGADDYVVKPFSANEVLARIEAVLRRSPERRTDVRGLTSCGSQIDLERREVHRNGTTTCALTEREAAILRYLAVNRARAVDRDELLHRVWGLDPKGIRTRTVDMTVARLREKIEPDPTQPTLVRTIRGKGYVLGDDVEVDT